MMARSEYMGSSLPTVTMTMPAPLSPYLVWVAKLEPFCVAVALNSYSKNKSTM